MKFCKGRDSNRLDCFGEEWESDVRFGSGFRNVS